MTQPDDDAPPPHPGPRIVLFGVPGRRDLARRAAQAAPGVRFAWRRDWTSAPSAAPHGPFARAHGTAGMWLWEGSAADFAARAEAVLLRFVHPLVAGGLPYCVGFPFEESLLAPRRLGLHERASLDLEDIGRLLGVSAAEEPRPGSAGARRIVVPRTLAAAEPVVPPPDRTLDPAQRAAVDHSSGPARVLAPAGSGKTKTLVSRVAELVRRGVDPGGILLLAFNREAAEQLEERLAVLGVPSTRRLETPAEPGARRRPGRAPVAGVHCATFNALGYRYQRQVLSARVTVDLDGPAQRALMRRAMDAAGVFGDDLRPARGSDPVGAFVTALTLVRAALRDPDEVTLRLETAEGPSPASVPFAAAHAEYLRLQQASGRQSFDDQIWFAVVDMLADPGRRRAVQDRFTHVLVDEFQDLNGAQLALVDVLSRPHRRLFVVGDDDQLIYGWRHADPRGILEFHARMPPPPHSATYVLQTNYRCSRAVVEAGARLVAHNAVREAKDIRPRGGAHDGAVRFAGAPRWPPRAAAVCAFLRAEHARLGCSWRDLAVLCRYRSQQLLVALALDDTGIPRTPTLGCRLFTHPAAQLLRGYVRLVQAPGLLDGAQLAGLLDRPNRFIGRATAERLASAPAPWDALKAAALREPPAGRRPLSGLVRQVEGLAEALRLADAERPLTAAELLWAVVDETGLEAYWQPARGDAATEVAAAGGSGASACAPAGRHAGADTVSGEVAGGAPDDAGDRDGAGPLQVLDALLLLAEVYPDPGAFFAVWERLENDERAHADGDGPRDGDDDRVVIGTIHAAKGREYHSIVVPDYDCDVTRWEKAAIEEERRVVYVGVTRARDEALFTVDTSRPYVHPFLRELVETPSADEYETLGAWLDQEEDAELRARITDRLTEIDVLFPESVPRPPDTTATPAEVAGAYASPAGA